VNIGMLEKIRRQRRQERTEDAVHYPAKQFTDRRERIQVGTDVRPDTAPEDAASLRPRSASQQRDPYTGSDQEN
jgi:hypothetical protein